ncbi:MAG TPA: hypothetical protein VN698_16915 [Bacteroidia bacterium]|nr:hypothetical protein [Bacteroidia bacterium]
MKTLLIAFAFLFSFTTHQTIADDVFICLSPSAKIYHKTKNCGSLQRCKLEIKNVTLKDAIDIYKRTACKICF